MKKLFFLCFIFFILFLLFSNTNQVQEKIDNEKTVVSEKRAIFISYIELQKYLKGKSEEEAKKNIKKMIKKLDDMSFNMVILQVRSFSDAIYDSIYYPWSKTISSQEGEPYFFDVLEYFISEAHSKKIELHAWINPYRVRTNSSYDDISSKNMAYSWLETNHVQITDQGIYYNPASSEVQTLILNGVEEILKKYSVDGIHFDDYFYPNLEIDQENYQEYIKTNKEISMNDYHLLMVNELIKKVHNLTQKYQVVFGISPEGNVENNYSKNQADVYTWGSCNDYVDYLMPQIYYGFYHEVKPFYDVVNEWDKIVENSNVKVIPALAFYKINQKDLYAKSGENEWIENHDMIMRQILISRNIKHYDGFSIFRYDSIFNEEQTKAVNGEVQNLKKILIN